MSAPRRAGAGWPRPSYRRGAALLAARQDHERCLGSQSRAACTRLGFRVACRLVALATAGCRGLLCCFLSDAEPFSRRGAFECGLLGFSRPHARFGTLSRALFAVWLRMNAELMPIGLGKIDVVVVRRLLDVCERNSAIGIGNVGNLIEARDRISHMRSIGQWLFPLLGKREDRVRQVASRCEVTMSFIRLPCRFRGFHCGTSTWIRGADRFRPVTRESHVHPRIRLRFSPAAALRGPRPAQSSGVGGCAPHHCDLTSVMQYLGDNGGDACGDGVSSQHGGHA